jgi:hypothetical protein
MVHFCKFYPEILILFSGIVVLRFTQIILIRYSCNDLRRIWICRIVCKKVQLFSEVLYLLDFFEKSIYFFDTRNFRENYFIFTIQSHSASTRGCSNPPAFSSPSKALREGIRAFKISLTSFRASLCLPQVS